MKEALRLRVKDIDFEYDNIYIYDSKSLKEQISKVKTIHQKDLQNGYEAVYIPYNLAKKYPNTSKDIKWQYLFPAKSIAIDKREGIERRHHIHEINIGYVIKKAVDLCGIYKRVTSYTFRHLYATHLLQNRTDIRSIQELLGHKSIKTTMIYIHVVKELNKDSIKSPLDF